ncbi:MAG: tetratricopeptide repeat protein [Candidatus Binatia bacterium]
MTLSRPVRATLFASALLVALGAGAAALAHEDPDLQVDEVTRSLALRPDDAALRLRRADLHRLRGDWSAAVADLQEARRLDPELALVDFTLAQVLFGADNPNPALDAVDRFLVRRPEHGAAHLLKARILARLGSSAQAVEEFSRGIALSKGQGKGGQPDDYLERARLQACSGNSRDGISAAIRGLDVGAAELGGAVTLQLRAVELEIRREHWDEALARLAVLEAKAHRKEQWMARRAEVLALAGRRDEARQAATAALAAIDALPAHQRDSRTTAALASGLRRQLSDDTSSTAGPRPVLLSRETDCPAPPAAL